MNTYKKYIFISIPIVILIIIFWTRDINIKETISFKNLIDFINPFGSNLIEYEHDKIYQDNKIVGENVIFDKIGHPNNKISLKHYGII